MTRLAPVLGTTGYRHLRRSRMCGNMGSIYIHSHIHMEDPLFYTRTLVVRITTPDGAIVPLTVWR